MSSEKCHLTSESLLATINDMKHTVNGFFVNAATRVVNRSLYRMLFELVTRAVALTHVKVVDTKLRTPGSISVKIGKSTLNLDYRWPHIGVVIIFEDGETLNEKHDLSDVNPKHGAIAKLLFILYTILTKDKKAVDELSADKQCAFIVDVCISDMHTARNSLAAVYASDFENVARVTTEAVDKAKERCNEVAAIVYN